jgi:hypothetical protein
MEAVAVQGAVAEGRLDWRERAWREVGPQGAAQRPELDAVIGESVRRGSTFLLAQSGLLATALALLSAYVDAPPHDIWRA